MLLSDKVVKSAQVVLCLELTGFHMSFLRLTQSALCSLTGLAVISSSGRGNATHTRSVKSGVKKTAKHANSLY